MLKNPSGDLDERKLIKILLWQGRIIGFIGVLGCVLFYLKKGVFLGVMPFFFIIYSLTILWELYMNNVDEF